MLNDESGESASNININYTNIVIEVVILLLFIGIFFSFYITFKNNLVKQSNDMLLALKKYEGDMEDTLGSYASRLKTNTLDKMFPKNIVIMWSGLLTEIPIGWQLCDGTNGAPDLQGRFIIGSGSITRTTNTDTAYGAVPYTTNVQFNMNTTGGEALTSQSNNSGGSTFGSGNISRNNMPPFYVLAYIIKL